METLTPGTILGGDYEVERLLAQGGMGAVYLARQRSTQKARAVKTMLAALVGDAALRSRFLREATVGARIESDHVVDVVAAGIDERFGIPWIAMEMLTGADLARTVTERGPLDRAAAIELARQLGHALSAAHRVSVIHRDLKPENIFLAQPRRMGMPFHAKVLDFGIAKLLGAVHTHATATALGSPLWMAPEQTDANGPVGPSTDLWSVGLIFFFALTGKTFWLTGNTEVATIASLIREMIIDPIPLASRRAAELGTRALEGLTGFDTWFSRCLQRDQAMRWQSADEAFAALVAVLEGRGIDAHPGDPPLNHAAIGTARTIETPAVSAPIASASAPATLHAPTNSSGTASRADAPVFSTSVAANAGGAAPIATVHGAGATPILLAAPTQVGASFEADRDGAALGPAPFVRSRGPALALIGIAVVLLVGGLGLTRWLNARRARPSDSVQTPPVREVIATPPLPNVASTIIAADASVSDATLVAGRRSPDTLRNTPTERLQGPQGARPPERTPPIRPGIVASNDASTSATVASIAAPTAVEPPSQPRAQPPQPAVCWINAGPLWNNDHARRTCPQICRGAGGRFDVAWRTTVPRQMSVCGCIMSSGRCP